MYEIESHHQSDIKTIPTIFTLREYELDNIIYTWQFNPPKKPVLYYFTRLLHSSDEEYCEFYFMKDKGHAYDTELDKWLAELAATMQTALDFHCGKWTYKYNNMRLTTNKIKDDERDGVFFPLVNPEDREFYIVRTAAILSMPPVLYKR